MSFSSLGLCDELLTTIAEQGYTKPTPIQVEAIPAVLSKRDVMAVAQTGTGKTAAFTLPMVQLLTGGSHPQAKSVRALIIAPTRELAAQVAESVEKYSSLMNIPSGAAFGGVRIEPQIAKLQGGLDILVATPGRLLDLYKQEALNFDHLEILVLDEADRMLDLGFIGDIRHIQTLLPINRQTLMFSATFSDDIKSLAKGMLYNSCLIEIAAENNSVDTVKQLIYSVDMERKSELLVHLIKKNKWPQLLVFSRTKHGADKLVTQLAKSGITSASIHANRTQHARTLALDGFKSGEIRVLIATDIISRGIDVSKLSCVINFNLPFVPEDYVHRIGRTGRAGSLGLAISFFSADETKQLRSIERVIDRQFELQIIPGFELSKKKKVQIVSSEEEDEYGEFVPDSQYNDRGKSKWRGSHGSDSSKLNRKKRKK